MRSFDLLGLEPYELTEAEARELLANFRSFEEEAFRSGAAEIGVKLNYTQESVSGYVLAAIEKMEFKASPKISGLY